MKSFTEWYGAHVIKYTTKSLIPIFKYLQVEGTVITGLRTSPIVGFWSRKSTPFIWGMSACGMSLCDTGETMCSGISQVLWECTTLLLAKQTQKHIFTPMQPHASCCRTWSYLPLRGADRAPPGSAHGCLCVTGSVKDMTAIFTHSHTHTYTPHLGMPLRGRKQSTAPRNACWDRRWQWWVIAASWEPAAWIVLRCPDNLAIRSRRRHWLLTLFLGRLSVVLFRLSGFQTRIPQACHTVDFLPRLDASQDVDTCSRAVGRSSVQRHISMEIDI